MLAWTISQCEVRTVRRDARFRVSQGLRPRIRRVCRSLGGGGESVREREGEEGGKKERRRGREDEKERNELMRGDEV